MGHLRCSAVLALIAAATWSCSDGAVTGPGAGGSSGAGGSGAGSCRPAAPPASGDPYADCVARINQFRECLSLTPYARWTEAESCVDQQVAYDRERGTPHAGFIGEICSPRGNAQNECLGGDFNRCTQRMFDEGPPPREPCTGQCFEDHGHYINMTSTRYTRMACGFDGDWSAQNFE